MGSEIIGGLRSRVVELNLINLVVAILGSIILSLILRWFYIRFGRSYSNRRSLGDTFLLLSVSVCLVIFLVKSSLALSLGLVGALSIVRFRAAIKEPEELVFLFFAITIGLGFGAEQKIATTLAFAITIPIVFIHNVYIKNRTEDSGMFLNLRVPGAENVKGLVGVLDKNSVRYELKRMDASANEVNSTFLVHLKKPDQIWLLQSEIKAQYPDGEISVINNSATAHIF